MKKVLSVLAVLAVVACLSSMAMASVVSSTLGGNVITRGSVFDATYGDANGTDGNNNRKGTTSGGTSSGDNWGISTCADLSWVSFDRSQIGTLPSSFDAYFIIPLNGGAAGLTGSHPVVGVFKSEGGSVAGVNGIEWGGTGNGPRYNRMNSSSEQWKFNGTKYSDFKAMVDANSTVMPSKTYTSADYEIITGAKVNNITEDVMKIKIDSSLLTTYVNDTSLQGFFWSNADSGKIKSWGGTQGGGSQCQSLMIVATPEPATLCMLAIGGLLLARRRT